MTGAIAMGTNKVTGLGAPTAGTDATTKTYVDAGDALQVLKAGDTMSGVLAMGANKITGLADPTAAQDAVTKAYVDTTNASNTAAASSASAAATSESNAGNSATAAAASYDAFDDRFLGSKSSDPTVDNDGSSLLTGAMYYSSSSSAMKVYNGSAWVAMAPSAANQNLINIVGGELVATEDLGSIATATTTSVGNKISVVGNAIANVNTVAGISANVTTVAGISANVTSVAGNASNINSAVSNASNINSAVSNASNINLAAGSIANVNLVGGSIANVNTVGASIADVNRYANQYTISSSAPSSPDAGDLWYDSSSGVNTLKYYTSSVWASISAGIASVAGDTSPQLAGTLDGQNNNLTNIGTVSGTNLQLDFGGL